MRALLTLFLVLCVAPVSKAGDFEMHEVGLTCGEYDFTVVSVCEKASFLDCLYQDVLVMENGKVRGKMGFDDFFETKEEEPYVDLYPLYKIVNIRCLGDGDSKIGLAIVTGGNCEYCEAGMTAKFERGGFYDIEFGPDKYFEEGVDVMEAD